MRRIAIALFALAAACSQATAGPPTTAAPVTVAPAATVTPPEASPPAPVTTTPVAPTTTTTDPPPREFFVFMPFGLPDDFLSVVAGVPGVEYVAVSHRATLHIVESRDSAGGVVDSPSGGIVIPVMARIVDDGDIARLLDTDVAPVLGDGDAVLGETSAAVRRIGEGGAITFTGGVTVRVAAVLPDEVVGGAEVIVLGRDRFPDADIETRSARIVYDGDGGRLEAAIGRTLDEDAMFRVTEIGGAGGQRVALVRSQAAIKARFGEFAYRPGRGGRFTIDPAWVEDNIVVADIPLLGEVRCHRDFAEILTAVMQSLVDDGLADVIDPDAFRGCWNARYIAGSRRLSRHSFGAAADINFGNDLDGGPGSPVHPELLERMRLAGVTSGHDWTNPDPGHFEWFGPGA